MKKRQIILISLMIPAQLLLAGQVQAEIFKCVNAKGVIFYNDKPCPKDNKQTEFQNIKDPKVTSSSYVVHTPSNQEKSLPEKTLNSNELSQLRSKQRMAFKQRGPGEDDEAEVQENINDAVIDPYLQEAQQAEAPPGN